MHAAGSIQFTAARQPLVEPVRHRPILEEDVFGKHESAVTVGNAIIRNVGLVNPQLKRPVVEDTLEFGPVAAATGSTSAEAHHCGEPGLAMPVVAFSGVRSLEHSP